MPIVMCKLHYHIHKNIFCFKDIGLYTAYYGNKKTYYSSKITYFGNKMTYYGNILTYCTNIMTYYGNTLPITTNNLVYKVTPMLKQNVCELLLRRKKKPWQ